MRPIVVSIEGVLAKEANENFASSAVNEEGMWLFNNALQSAWPILVTGSTDRAGVNYWLSSNGIGSKSVEFPTYTTKPSFSRTLGLRILVLERVVGMYRGDLIVVDSSTEVCKVMTGLGVTVLQPYWGRVRAAVDENDMMPLRALSQTWGE